MVRQVRRKGEPAVLARRPYRAYRCGEGRIGETADRDAQERGRLLALPVHRRAASRAEMVVHAGATVGDAAPGAALAFDREHLALAPERGRAEQRAGAALASEAVARRNQ